MNDSLPLKRWQLPDDWTPEQALAVFELLNELTDILWSRYQVPIVELLEQDHRTGPDPQLDLFDCDDPIPF
jgi:hypothetical protein